MKFNLYQLFNNPVCLNKINLLDERINHKLNKIENEIINEFLKKQIDSIGIEKLGVEIRKNDIINNELNNPQNNEDFVIIKLTENKRSFKHVFLESLYSYYDFDLYFLVLEKDFGNDSNLVDKSFIEIREVERELKKLFNFFQPKSNLRNIYFIEFKGFKHYRILTSGKYSKIFKNE